MIETIIFDWKRTLYNPENHELINGTKEVLQQLGMLGINLYIVGKDQEGDMSNEVVRLSISSLFKGIHFTRDSKTSNDFDKYISTNKPESIVVVGDRVRSEIEVANKLGLNTVWIRQGKFADEIPLNMEQEPDYIISNLQEFIPLLTQINR